MIAGWIVAGDDAVPQVQPPITITVNAAADRRCIPRDGAVGDDQLPAEMQDAAAAFDSGIFVVGGRRIAGDGTVVDRQVAAVVEETAAAPEHRDCAIAGDRAVRDGRGRVGVELSTAPSTVVSGVS